MAISMTSAGIVYTGIYGYGLCSITPNLKQWSKIGTHELLKENIKGLVVFEHKGETLIAATLDFKKVVLIVTL